jgi:hypothetical protein
MPEEKVPPSNTKTSSRKREKNKVGGQRPVTAGGQVCPKPALDLDFLCLSFLTCNVLSQLLPCMVVVLPFFLTL